ncbi:MAG: metallophosphoesterase family protein [Spirochaetes bacterium]|nr:metallophosphoesterase family protein [Spirochaetota bacterium]
MKILVLSDIHGAMEKVRAASDLIAGADLVVIAGDITRKGGRGEAEELLGLVEARNRKILAVHGNMDRDEVRALLEERGYGVHGAGRVVGGTGFFGVGGSNITPVHTRSEYDEETIMELLEKGYDTVRGAREKVLVSHTPPKGICDRTFLFIRAGSVSVRDFLAAHDDVRLCLCGHIHEAAGWRFEGNACVANAGAFKRGRYLEVDFGAGITVRPGRLK